MRRATTLLALPLCAAAVVPPAHAIPPAFGVNADCAFQAVNTSIEHVTIVAHARAVAWGRAGAVATRVECTISRGSQTLSLARALPGHVAVDAGWQTFDGSGFTVCWQGQAWWFDGEVSESGPNCEVR